MVQITSPYSKDPITVTMTDDEYWAHQPTPVQALRNSPDDQRFGLAMDLAKQGYVIDVPIMVWGWDPKSTMAQRVIDGYTWVPSAMQPNIPIGPGIINVWNLTSYDKDHPPIGSVIVSVNAADYPAFAAVVSHPPVTGGKIVGDAIGGGWFRPGFGAVVDGKIVVTDGETVQQDGVSYVAHVTMGLMGLGVIFKQA